MPLMVSELTRLFLAWADQALAPATTRIYQYQLQKFVRSNPALTVAELRPMHLSAWAKTWHEAQALVRLCRWAVDEAGLIDRSPLERVKMPPRQQRHGILSPAEMARFLRRSRPAGRRFLLAMRETYARPQEIRGLLWTDLASEVPGMPIDDALAAGKALAVLREYKDRRRRKDSSRPRVLLISRRLGRLILRLKRDQPAGTEHVFLNTHDLPWSKNAVRCLLRRLRRLLGYQTDRWGQNVVAYTFRHSCATHAASRGVTDRLLADILGHVETRTTARYQHLNVGHLRAAMEAAAKRRRNPEQGT